MVPHSLVSVAGSLTLKNLCISITGTSYIAELMFSPLSSSMDNGTYMCITTLTPRQPQFVTGNSTSDSMTLAVRGKIIRVVLPVLIV